ncbi:toll/interleukin-1 receptor domain-containing protein [Cryptosporangium japonicum]|uniref:SEFIR domain-containing protein n=1 Tax=Cryptosporangium japonicum TaxID=80872 RepID=A0ABN0UDM2_9ACTN
MASVRVFLSYAHDSPEHSADVCTLWTLLRERGIDARLDLPAAERRTDWPAWMRRQIDRADFVLVIASPEYRRTADGLAERDERRGVRFEAMELVEELYRDHESGIRKIVPVLLPGRTREDVPRFLRPYSTSYVEVAELSGAGVEPLLRLLTGQPAVIGIELGEPPVLGPRLPPVPPLPGMAAADPDVPGTAAAGPPGPGTAAARSRRVVWVGAGSVAVAAVVVGVWGYAAGSGSGEAGSDAASSRSEEVGSTASGAMASGAGVPESVVPSASGSVSPSVVLDFVAPRDGRPFKSGDGATGIVTGSPDGTLWAVERTSDDRFHPRKRCDMRKGRWDCPAFKPRTPVGGAFDYHVVLADPAADETLSRAEPRGLLRLPPVAAERVMSGVINAG